MSKPKVDSEHDAQAVVKQELRRSYGDRVKVNFSKTILETGKNGGKLWVVEGDAEIKKWLFWKKNWHLTYYVDIHSGKIWIMRCRRR